MSFSAKKDVQHFVVEYDFELKYWVHIFDEYEVDLSMYMATSWPDILSDWSISLNFESIICRSCSNIETPKTQYSLQRRIQGAGVPIDENQYVQNSLFVNKQGLFGRFPCVHLIKIYLVTISYSDENTEVVINLCF